MNEWMGDLLTAKCLPFASLPQYQIACELILDFLKVELDSSDWLDIAVLI